MTDELLDAVDLLTRDRVVHTTLTDDDGVWVGVHSETHPPLLRLLIDGTGLTRSAGSSDIKLPIDADALELFAQISERVRAWCRALHVAFDGDGLLSTMRRWYVQHANRVRSGQVSETIDQEITRTVESWVRMIENKFERDEKREWKDPCPATVTGLDEQGELVQRRCGARRILLEGQEKFAIELNVTTLTATCRQCGHVWTGREGLSELRFLTNVEQNAQIPGAYDPVAYDLLNTQGK